MYNYKQIEGIILKKYKGLFIFMSLILLMISIYIGLFLLCSNCALNGWLVALCQFIGFVLVLPLFVAIHEAGHMVFGLFTGYALLTYKVGPFEWYKKDDKIKFRVNPLSSMVLGQCLMIPPKPKKKVKPKFYLYNAGGLIFSYLFVLALIGLFFIIPNGYIKHLLIPLISLSIFLSINNSIYQKGGINDVCNHVLVKNNPKYINSILFQLEMVANISSGKRYGAKTLYEPYFEDKLNHITLTVAQLRFYQAIDKSDFVEAKRISDIITKNYRSTPILLQKLSVIFIILYADIVISNNMSNFKRHFKWIGEKEKSICMKYEYDLKYYYDIFEMIYNGNYNINEKLEKFLRSDLLMQGEKLSLEKMFSFLIEKLDFYVKNGKSFIVKE